MVPQPIERAGIRDRKWCPAHPQLANARVAFLPLAPPRPRAWRSLLPPDFRPPQANFRFGFGANFRQAFAALSGASAFAPPLAFTSAA